MTMNTEINQVLAQMRALTQEVSSSIEPKQRVDGGAGFADALAESIDWVNANQSVARDLTQAFERGDENTSLAEVMVAVQKASISFEAVSQVRNELLSAYREVMNMPV